MIDGLVTTVIPVFNRGEMLKEAVSSVLAQSYAAVEIVIVDDGSSDDTRAVAVALAASRSEQVRVVVQENGGPGAARNLGLAHSRGEFIQYLDSDDVLTPHKFESQVRALREHPEAGLAYGLTRRLNMETGESCDWARTGEEISDIFPDFLIKRGWDTNSPLWRRSTCDTVGPWSHFRCLEDWEHDLRAGILRVKPVRVSEHVATVRDHGGSRASGMHSGFTPALTRDFFRAHRSIWQRMREADLTEWRYLDSFSRKMFWIARMCGERRLLAEADEALDIAQEMMSFGHRALGVRSFRIATRLLGWPASVAIAERLRGIGGRFRV